MTFLLRTGFALALLTPLATASAQAVAPALPKASKPSVTPASLIAPDWADLSPQQKAALKPLEASWSGMNPNQRRKWMEVAPGFANLSPDEKAKVHARMAAWTALSPQQRANARLNFSGAAAGLTPGERKAKWDAYQALPPEERQRLRAQGKAEQPKSMALAATPASSERLAAVPRGKPEAASSPRAPDSAPVSGKTRAKIAVSSSPVAAAP